MTKKDFFKEMNELQKVLDKVRSTLFTRIAELMDGKGEVHLTDEDNTDGNAPLVYCDGDSIEITSVLDKDKVYGMGENGNKYELDIADLGIDDVKAITECLAQVVLK